MSEINTFNQCSLQELAAPDGVCFGCGQKNANGLQIKSYWDVDNIHVIMTHMPDSRYVGWPSLVYGGLISCLVDCLLIGQQWRIIIMLKIVNRGHCHVLIV